jgi:hypothetical protein
MDTPTHSVTESRVDQHSLDTSALIVTSSLVELELRIQPLGLACLPTRLTIYWPSLSGQQLHQATNLFIAPSHACGLCEPGHYSGTRPHQEAILPAPHPSFS